MFVLLHPLSTANRSVSSVGSERFLHTEEVESSNLPQTTIQPLRRGFFFTPTALLLYLIRFAKIRIKKRMAKINFAESEKKCIFAF